MDSEPIPPRRRSIRLPTYDYAQGGAYFVTLCAYHRRCLFGQVVSSEMRVNELGAIVEEEWFRSPAIRPHVVLDAFVTMPNHVHGIVFLDSDVGASGRPPVQPSGPARSPLGAFVGGFKAAATRRLKALHDAPEGPLWQRNYYEHIIRDNDGLAAIREYIENNPANWANDRENPEALQPSRSAVWEPRIDDDAVGAVAKSASSRLCGSKSPQPAKILDVSRVEKKVERR